MKLPVSILFISLSSTAFSAELVLNNGNILQVDSGFNTASAIAIDAGEIVAIGSDKEVSTHITDTTEVIDLEGRTVIPGLIDNHMHLVRAAQNWGHQIRLEGITDYQQALKQIADTAARAKPGQWLVASGGFVERQFSGRPKAGFLRSDLDKAAPDNPVYLQHLFDWGYANSAALKTIGVNPDSPPQMPGLLLDGDGQPQGPVTKRAQFLLEEQLTANTKKNRLEQSRKALTDLARAGLTTVVDAGGFDTLDSLYEPFETLNSKGEMPIRLMYMKQVIPWGRDNLSPDLSRLDGVNFRSDDDFFRPVGVGEQLMLPVQDTAGRAARSTEAVKTAFLNNARKLAKRGIQLHLHAVNDASINQHLDAFETINETYPLAPLRWTFAHIDGIQPDTIERARALGILFAIHSRPVLIGYRFQNSFGSAAMNMTPMKTLTEKGALWGLGSDSPVVSIYNPFRTLWWAVNGRMVDGTKVSEQNVDRRQALVAHTINNARLAFMEDKTGSLETGKRADLLILNQDYMRVDSSKIASIRPLATMVDGRWVYKAGELGW
ncbi:amidohydrolase [Aliamphritea hakodatensis]|uniref:amidohydrolase n=1 Tax=Aliamphritea hakodatensis TaxID=2895352 RepID=UPI0022FD4F55|nr:amidohydrolase [Aliamphritea hakodatensis]